MMSEKELRFAAIYRVVACTFGFLFACWFAPLYAHAESPGASALDAVFGPFDPGTGTLIKTAIDSVMDTVKAVLAIATVTEVTYFFLRRVFYAGSLSNAMKELSEKFLTLGIISAVVLSCDVWYPGVWQFFAGLGTTMASHAMPNAGYFVKPTVGSIADQGLNLSWALMTPFDTSNPNWVDKIAAFLGNIGNALIMIPTALAVILCYCSVAVQFGMAEIQYFLFSFGVVLLGLLALRQSQPIGQGVIHLAITLGVKVLAISGYTVIMSTFAKYIIQELQLNPLAVVGGVAAAAGAVTGNGEVVAGGIALGAGIYLQAFAGAVILGLVGWNVPKLAEAWLTGTPTMGMGELISMASTAALLGATAAAAVPAAGAMGGAIGAAGSAAAAGGGGASGLASSLPRGAVGGAGISTGSAQERQYTAQQMASMFGEMRGSAHLQLH
jgi:hypothetical protein